MGWCVKSPKGKSAAPLPGARGPRSSLGTLSLREVESQLLESATVALMITLVEDRVT